MILFSSFSLQMRWNASLLIVLTQWIYTETTAYFINTDNQVRLYIWFFEMWFNSNQVNLIRFNHSSTISMGQSNIISLFHVIQIQFNWTRWSHLVKIHFVSEQYIHYMLSSNTTNSFFSNAILMKTFKRNSYITQESIG